MSNFYFLIEFVSYVVIVSGICLFIESGGKNFIVIYLIIYFRVFFLFEKLKF